MTTLTLITLASLAALALGVWLLTRRRSQLEAYDRALQEAARYAARAQDVADRAFHAGRLPTPREHEAIDRFLAQRDMAMRQARAARGGEERAS
jgi:hypothetical protein